MINDHEQRRTERRHCAWEHLAHWKLEEEMVRLTMGLNELCLEALLDEDGLGNLRPCDTSMDVSSSNWILL